MSRQPTRTTPPTQPVKQSLPEFEVGTQYEITVSRVVELAPDLYARPSSSKIVIAGEKAEEIKDAILTAKKIAFLE